mgnify:CR=1 FL=1
MKNKTYIYLLLLSFIFACNNNDDILPEEMDTDDDPIEEEVNSLPSEFEITINEINYTNAAISWSEATSTLPNPITYDVLLNNILIAEQLVERTYLIEDLLPNTIYNLKIIAKNEIGETSITVDFSTPELMQVRLRAIIISEDEGTFRTIIDYNEQGQIIERKNITLFSNNNENLLLKYTYEYIDSKISSATTGNYYWAGISDAVILDYTYNGTDLQQLTAHEIDDIEGIRRIHIFNSPTQYEYEKIDYNYGAPPTSTYHSVELTINENNELLEYVQNNITDGTTSNLSFQYENNNLTKVTDGNNVFEIVYDESPNYLTFSHNGYVNDHSSGLNESQYRLVGGIPQVKAYLFPFHTLRRIPYFLTYSNKNNPLQYKLNGTVITEFEYTYNVYGYPGTMTVIRPDDDNYSYILEYEEID